MAILYLLAFSNLIFFTGGFGLGFSYQNNVLISIVMGGKHEINTLYLLGRRNEEEQIKATDFHLSVKTKQVQKPVLITRLNRVSSFPNIIIYLLFS